MEQHRFYGRRHGRPLSAERALGLRDAGCDILINPATLARAFPNNAPLHLEIGFGGGERLAQEAQRSPDENFLGCEAFINGVASLIRYIRQDVLNNIRIFPDDVRLILEALPDQSLTTCWVLYPDPWPKRRHIGRRILGTPTLDRLARVLRPKAPLITATDVPALASWMHTTLAAHPTFTLVYDSHLPPEGWISTRYEAKAQASGRVSRYLMAQRR